MDSKAWALCFLDEGVALSVISRKETRCQWLEDEGHAHEHLLNDYVHYVAELGELDPEQTAIAKERFVLLMEQYPEPEALTEYINDLTVGLTRILWFGPVSALAEDYGDFPLALRAFYWQEYGEGDEDPVTPIVEDDWIYMVECMDEFLLQDDY
ncbi:MULTISPECIES: hypothetical protein [Oceanisphaera]|uniref:Uncharacterized protein n=1 Tax=Oceanisphaera ostreae TaxID=914151 RepID=A0ABW3KBW7_9GAMM